MCLYLSRYHTCDNSGKESVVLFQFLTCLCMWGGAFVFAADFLFTHPEITKKQQNLHGLHFKGYTYISSKEWIVWVNDTRISPNSQIGEIRVVEAFPNSVTFEWSNLGKTVVVTLNPGENYEQSH